MSPRGKRGRDPFDDDEAGDDTGRHELLNPTASSPEVVDEADDRVGLRPRSLAEFVGQTDLKQRMTVILGAARKRGHPPDHMLFAGPPGLGKTTLAHIV